MAETARAERLEILPNRANRRPEPSRDHAAPAEGSLASQRQAFEEGFAALRRIEKRLTGAAEDLVEAYRLFHSAAAAAGIRPDGLPRHNDLMALVERVSARELPS